MKRFLCLLLALAMFAVCAVSSGEEGVPSALTLFAVNVRKADCLLLSSGNDVYMIDTGSPESWGQVSRALKELGIPGLTGVILTHTDKDHAGGLDALCASGIRIGGIYASVYYNCKRTKHPAVLAAEKYDLPFAFLARGDVLPLGGGEIRVLGPVQKDSELENNNSLVLLASGGGGSALLTGDMEFPEETSLLDAGLIPEADILKVANHGESDATGEALVKAVRPSVAVISTNSDDESDTPSKRVLKLLSRCGVQMASTQNASLGVLAAVENGQTSVTLVQAAQLPSPAFSVKLTGKDSERDTVTLTNTADTPQDLSGWYLLSERGGGIFVFPDGTVLPAGASLTVSTLSSPSEGDLIWREKNVWHKTKADRASLCDAFGRLIDELD